MVYFCLVTGPTDAGDWPQWRGPNRDGHAATGGTTLNTLPKELKPLWQIQIGPGFSSPVVAGAGLIYLDERNQKEMVHRLDAATGKEIWAVPLDEAFGDEWGVGPRSTPFVDGDRVYVQSCRGEFRCLDLKDGKTVWRTNFEKDFSVAFVGSKANEGTASRRGNNGSGLADADRVYVPVGSTNGASIVCFNKSNGKILWKALNDEAAYSSFVLGTLAGVKQVVALTADALVGVDPVSGRPLWRVPFKTNAKRHAASPVIIGPDNVTVNSHTFGLVCVKISKSGDEFKASEAWANRTQKINLATPVLVGNYLFCQGAIRDYVCVDARTGELMWSQAGLGTAVKEDCSFTIAVGANLLILTYDGMLVLVAADSTRFHELGRLQVCGKTWSHPAFADGRLYVRDGRQLLCLDLPKAD